MEAASSGASAYNPIRSLDQQYFEPVGTRLMLLIKANPNCCYKGGVEALIRASKGRQGVSMSNSMVAPPSTTSLTVDSSTSVEATPSGNTTVTSSNGGDDPFAFLGEPDPSSSSSLQPTSSVRSSVSTTPQASTNLTKTRPNKPGLGRMFTNLTKKATQSLETGMQQIAIRADGGKSPDQVILGIYDANSGALWNMTEYQTNPEQDTQRLKGINFHVPLEIPAGTPTNTAFSLKLWIKSGASTFLKSKHYLLGEATLHPSQLLASVPQPPMKPWMFSVPLNSQVVVDGKLHLCVAPDPKIAPELRPGWSLTDPARTAYTERRGLHRWPLDQSYHYGAAALVATERATESSVVLPVAAAFMALCNSACQISQNHCADLAAHLLHYRIDAPPDPSASFAKAKAKASIGMGYMLLNNATSQPLQQAMVTVNWQRPDSIFEVEIVKPTPVRVHPNAVQYTPILDQPFYPKLTSIKGALPAIQARYNQPNVTPPPYILGNLSINVALRTTKTATTGANPFDQVGPTSQAIQGEEEFGLAVFALDGYVNKPQEVLQVPVYHSKTKAPMGSIVIQLSIQVDPSATVDVPPISTSKDGLVSLVGLDTLMETSGAAPPIDYELPDASTYGSNQALQRRQAQLSTMGLFYTHPYMHQHFTQVRLPDARLLQQKAHAYSVALVADPETIVPSYEERAPSSFRPSSSRQAPLVASIPFNVHIQSLGLSKLPNGDPVGTFHNITCGAPADHARGFAEIYQGGPSGGLRRLEQKRLELQQQVADAQTHLILGVSNYFVTSRQTNPHIYHVPAHHSELMHLRWKVFQAIQNLHTVTWHCAMRRTNVFSQALGIAMSSLLASLSDVHKVGQKWPDLWVRHGYLVSYEGLLSAAGKELGMIEDASVGIAMLRMCSVQLIGDDGNGATQTPTKTRVVIPHSPHLKWLQMEATGCGSKTQYKVTIGVDRAFYASNVPEPLRNGKMVRFYPLLFQVGVDIRQWGANTGMKASLQLKDNVASVAKAVRPDEVCGSTGNVENEFEDEDMSGIEDNDVLIALNYEALRKMNVYAHAISPLPTGAAGQGHPQLSGEELAVHPVLSSLHAHIVGSAGKMNHGILDEAAQVAQKLGGGGVVFCKSGKDRTAMHVTFKQAQYVHSYLRRVLKNPRDAVDITEDANRMRVYGTRLPICEKNVGQAKYAFNTLQVRFMPDALKPPINTLAGFLKGGDIFKKGGMES